MDTIKQRIHDFWNEASCGESLYLQGLDRNAYEAQSRSRYELEPFILDFMGFDAVEGKQVLEIGVGLGADHQCFAQSGAQLWGIDLTERAVDHTQRRLEAFGLSSHLAVGDAEYLDFPDERFDIVYSWGVLHHNPDTARGISEMWRVLKSGGTGRVMIYHKWSLVGFMLWFRYAVLGLQPGLSLKDIYNSYLESPGTQAFSKCEARQLFSRFREVSIRTVLTHGDLLESMAGRRHQGLLLSLARKLWPRQFIRRFLPGLGLFMLVEARK